MQKKVCRTAPCDVKLELFLKKEFALTGKQIRQAKFRENGILVNGTRKRVTEQLHVGDFVEVLLEEINEQRMLPADGELVILYEDEDLLVLNKPEGVVVHPSHGHYSDSILNLAAAYYTGKHETVKLRVVGRLDKDTSGVLVLAKNQVSASRLYAQKEEGIFTKEYLAVTEQRPLREKGTITSPLERDTGFLMKMRTCQKGLSAVTHYEVLKYSERNAPPYLLSVTIETGRTHQIRVHLASIGCPLVGDVLYGEGVSDLISRTALHAWKCSFRHPFSGERLNFCAELPSDIRQLLSCLPKIDKKTANALDCLCKITEKSNFFK